MVDATKTFSDVKNVIHSFYECEDTEDKISFYNNWAEKYEQDVAELDYRAPILAAECLSTSFQGDREKAVVLDVACGTGLVATLLQKHGFRKFVGVDASNGMLEVAQSKGLYQELKQSILGMEALPVQAQTYDVVVIVGALSFSHVPVTIIRELWEAAKPGGYMCLTTKGNADNKEYNNHLRCTLKKMEQDRLWACVSVTEVDDWQKAVLEHESGYIPGTVYLYRKTAQS